MKSLAYIEAAIAPATTPATATAALYLRVDPELDKALRQEAERRNVTLTALRTELLSKVAKAKR